MFCGTRYVYNEIRFLKFHISMSMSILCDNPETTVRKAMIVKQALALQEIPDSRRICISRVKI